VLAEDALTILPPTRRYTDPEVRKALAERGVDGVLLITVADTGVVSRRHDLPGVIQRQASATGSVMPMGNGAAVALNGTAQGEAVGSATPTYRYARQTSVLCCWS
jgi:hypothetical protein